MPQARPAAREVRIVKIWQVDEYGYPWYEVSLVTDNGETEEHTLMVYDDGNLGKGRAVMAHSVQNW